MSCLRCLHTNALNTFVTDIIHVQSGSIESIITFGNIGVGGVQTGRKMGLYIETIKLLNMWIGVVPSSPRPPILGVFIQKGS